MKFSTILSLLLSVVLSLTDAHAELVAAAPAGDKEITIEYFVDSDPGIGKAEILDAKEGSNQYAVSLGNYSAGAHIFGVRAVAEGMISPTVTYPVYIVDVPLYDDLEYFYDNDPGFGNGHQIDGAEGRNSFILPLEDDMSAGAHLLGVRCRDKDGNWSVTEVYPLFIMPLVELERVEYYVDDDPGEGYANAVAMDNNGKASFAISTTDMEIGDHRLNLRGKDMDGDWHDLFSRGFTVDKAGGVESVTWSSGLRLSMTDGSLSVLPSGLSEGTVIEVFTLDGILINRTVWENTEDALHINVGRHSCLIVRAVEPDGYYCVETIR